MCVTLVSHSIASQERNFVGLCWSCSLFVGVRHCCSLFIVFACRLLSVFVGLCWSILTLIRVIAGIVKKKGGGVEIAMQFFVVSSRYCALLALSYRYTVQAVYRLYRLYIVIAIYQCKIASYHKLLSETIISVVMAIVLIRPIILIRYTRNSYCLDSTIVFLSLISVRLCVV